ncbi:MULTISPECIES: ribosome maturation factor RimM [unclassified Eubacterium (in: firmicutes)]|uniref:ribosome maturation factor RimM n=1 Tax=unclassified Eubacterium (in: firmicutes) TaxID=2624479 RepID=UPI000E4AACD4|nr:MULTISPECIES: ribosome maturation factor RimM [unclassified Eubacterium (in: firmicutes)]RGF51023.1 ribosome maturation factor RimM [Eubacterium sp. AF36-5BH]RHP21754.1 ribosome maturation factor RimM [Eubacterium sp. AF34-35BH]
MEQYLRVGVITNSHGIKGEVKVFPTTDDIKRFDYLEEAVIDTGKEYINVNVTGVKYFKNMVILKFKQYDNINDILKFKGLDLLVSRENAIPLGEDEHFIVDLIGCNVVDEEKNYIGELVDVMETGANGVYVVKTPEGREVLFPVIEQCVLNKDIKNKTITVHVMKGLMD